MGGKDEIRNIKKMHRGIAWSSLKTIKAALRNPPRSNQRKMTVK